MMSIETDSLLGFCDCVIDEPKRAFAMPAFVGSGGFEVGFCSAEMLEGGVHAGLIGGGAACDESGGDDEGEEQCGDDATTGHSILLTQ
jgi:hypothetical protein